MGVNMVTRGAVEDWGAEIWGAGIGAAHTGGKDGRRGWEEDERGKLGESSLPLSARFSCICSICDCIGWSPDGLLWDVSTTWEVVTTP